MAAASADGVVGATGLCLSDSREGENKLSTIRINTKGVEARLLKSKKTYDPTRSILTDNEKRVLDWVVGKLGDLSANEISEIFHEETAFKNTPKGAPSPTPSPKPSRSSRRGVFWKYPEAGRQPNFEP